MNNIREKLGVQKPEEVVSWLNCMFYGDPGVGKTRLSSTAQDHEDTAPILLIDIDGGLVTIKDRPDIDVKPLRSIKELEKIHNDIFMEQEMYYKTVIIDSLTELQKLDIRNIMQDQFNKKPEITDVDVPDQRAYGKSNMHITKIVRAFRDLPCHTIFTCLATRIIDEATNVTEIFPSLPGKQRAEIPGYLDIVGYMHVTNIGNELVRRVQFAKTRRIAAKDRTDTLGDFVDNPSIPLLWEIVSNGKPPENKESNE